MARATPSSLRRSVASSLHTAFTLVELIISIGLVLVIMLGVNFVFKMTSDTINAGQSLNENMRNSRASQAVMFEDFARYAPDGACLLIKSRSQLAFRNRADQDGDSDYLESDTQGNRENQITTIVDLNKDGDFIDRGEFAMAAVPGDRSHRVDVISFFARGVFTRQTGGDVGGGGVAPANEPLAPLVSDMTSNEAWVWYGHLALPNNNGNYYLDNVAAPKTYPGFGTATTNPNNFFAASWALGRFAGLLVEPYDHDNSSGTAPVILDKIGSGTGKPQVFIGRDPTLASNSNSRSPLTSQSSAYSAQQAGSTVSRGGNPLELLDSRFDLIGTSISGFRTILAQVLTPSVLATLTNGNWWDEMMLTTRFETSPFLVKPIRAPGYAAQAPFFRNGCTQFIVEYAGDFVTQERDPNNLNFGQVTGAFFDAGGNSVQTDGEIDFIVLGDTNGDGQIQPGERPRARKAIRWYGMPRDVDGDGVVQGNPTGSVRNNQMKDVVPLRDVIRGVVSIPAPFEKFITGSPTELIARTNYADLNSPMPHDEVYTCAWGPNDTVRPRMIRITMVVDDPTGRTVEPQTHEYVFNLPAAE